MKFPKMLTAAVMVSAFGLASCSNGDPLENGGSSGSGGGETIVIGSQDYYSNEIIAEIYAQALEGAGFSVDRQFRIGQREVYVSEIESGAIDLFPEYSGPLLQYWAPDTQARKSEDVYAELAKVTPEGLRVLDQAAATDQDSYAVTSEFAAQWSLSSIEDLAGISVPMVLGANSEAETRPNGPRGLRDVYGIDVGFTPIEDGGGPLTVKALTDNQIQLAIIYTASPSVVNNNLVTLSDPRGQFLASHVVPVASDDVSDEAAEVVNAVSAVLTERDLIELNARSVNEQTAASVIAKDWLVAKGL
ncbi:ABC transporter substrate-binding protein [Corynebacterium sp. 76QC2CO]|nr:ABC transporter substrate-binding protein [Corynebacterium sp. 76QC2CO]MCQ9344213.1 ABC transporter substrate-binding protein [Corynebacterium sp. 76QC2CO]